MKSSVRWDDSWKRKQHRASLQNRHSSRALRVVFLWRVSDSKRAFTARFAPKRTSDNVSYVRFGGLFPLGNSEVGIIVRAGTGRWSCRLVGSLGASWCPVTAQSRGWGTALGKREIWGRFSSHSMLSLSGACANLDVVFVSAVGAEKWRLREGGS